MEAAPTRAREQGRGSHAQRSPPPNLARWRGQPDASKKPFALPMIPQGAGRPERRPRIRRRTSLPSFLPLSLA